MDEDSTTQDAPLETQVDSTTDTDTSVNTDEQQVASDGGKAVGTTVDETSVVTDDIEDYGYPQYNNLPDRQGIDFSNLAAGEDGLIDPNALAGSINQQIALAEERATQRAQNAFQEQQAETRAWDKAIEKYPDLKGNRDLRDMIQQARIGQFTESFNRNGDPANIKLKTPMQVADNFFKHIGTAKAEGMKQATTNTVVQQSAHVETASRRTSDTSETRSKLYQNINNPNKEVAKKARQDILKGYLFGDN